MAMVSHFLNQIIQAFHSAVKKFEEGEIAGVKGATKVPLQGRGTASPWGLVRGQRPLRKIGVSGHFEAKYGLF